MKRAVCNELFGEIDFRRTVDIVAGSGFQGLEIAPHTLFGDFSGNPESRLPEIRRVLKDEGLVFAGFHWLLVGPPGLRVNDPDPAIRRRSWDHIRRLADLGGALGGGPLTLGSPVQRSSEQFRSTGVPSPGAPLLFIEGLQSVADHVAAAGCRLLVEALPSAFTDVVNTLAEARTVIDSIGKPGIGGMFDFHNTDDETDPWDVLIRSHTEHTEHVHLNDPDGNAPTLATEYRKAFAVLREKGYEKWVSLEIFTVPENPEQVLRQVSGFLDELEPDNGR
jgi:sugar phosphate isomerase/epimerase